MDHIGHTTAGLTVYECKNGWNVFVSFSEKNIRIVGFKDEVKGIQLSKSTDGKWVRSKDE